VFDVSRWIGWLDPERDDGLVAQLWNVLGPISRKVTGRAAWSGSYFPLTLLRAPQYPLETILERHGPDLIQLLFLDHSDWPLKAERVAEELARDYCAREGGMTLLARHSGLDLHDREEVAEEAAPAGQPPRSADTDLQHLCNIPHFRPWMSCQVRLHSLIVARTLSPVTRRRSCLSRIYMA
jgi:hypothetical protein